MNFLQAIKSGFDRMFDFRTRSSHSEYWHFTLFVLIITFALFMILFGGVLPSEMDDIMTPFNDIFAKISTFTIVVLCFFLLVLSIAGIALSVRRLHDLDWSGWWMLLIYVLPILLIFAVPHQLDTKWMYLAILWIVMFISSGFLILLCIKGTTGANRFGDDPLSSS